MQQNGTVPWSYLFTTCQLECHLHPKDTLHCLHNNSLHNDEADEADEKVINEDIEAMEEADWQLYSQLFPNHHLPIFDISNLGQ